LIKYWCNHLQKSNLNRRIVNPGDNPLDGFAQARLAGQFGEIRENPSAKAFKVGHPNGAVYVPGKRGWIYAQRMQPDGSSTVVEVMVPVNSKGESRAKLKAGDVIMPERTGDTEPTYYVYNEIPLNDHAPPESKVVKMCNSNLQEHLTPEGLAADPPELWYTQYLEPPGEPSGFDHLDCAGPVFVRTKRVSYQYLSGLEFGDSDGTNWFTDASEWVLKETSYTGENYTEPLLLENHFFDRQVRGYYINGPYAGGAGSNVEFGASPATLLADIPDGAMLFDIIALAQEWPENRVGVPIDPFEYETVRAGFPAGTPDGPGCFREGDAGCIGYPWQPATQPGIGMRWAKVPTWRVPVVEAPDFTDLVDEDTAQVVPSRSATPPATPIPGHLWREQAGGVQTFVRRYEPTTLLPRTLSALNGWNVVWGATGGEFRDMVAGTSFNDRPAGGFVSGCWVYESALRPGVVEYASNTLMAAFGRVVGVVVSPAGS
jgi:hypothetical protein